MNWRAIMKGETPKSYSHNSQNPQNSRDNLNIANIAIIAKEIERWNPELADQGYVWCMDCQYWDNLACKHIDNPYRKQCVHVPRICQWYEAVE